MNIKKFSLIVFTLASFPLLTFAQAASPWIPTNNYLKPVNANWGLLVPGLATSTTGCLSVASNGWISANGSACGGSGSFPFTAETHYGQTVYSTSTPTLWLKSGLFASSTSIFTALNSSFATTTYASSTALTATNLWATNAYLTKLSNLTSNGFVKTSNADGTLSVDTTTYESGLTAGDGLTRTSNDFDCDTASGTVFGCLSSTDWTTFNGKESALTFNWPLVRSTNTISFSGLATSSTWTAGNLAYVIDNATLRGVATTSLTATSPLALSQPISVIGASASALSIDTTGTWSGNAGTATALAANGSNCSAGSFPLGVSALGAAEDCTDAWTEAENTSAAYVPGSRTVSTTYPLTGGGALSGNLTIALAFGTTTSNTWANTQTFTNPIINGTLTGLIGGNSGTTYAVATSTISLGSVLATITNASTTNFSVGTWLGIPNAADPTIGVAGAFALNTTAASSSIRAHDGTAERAVYFTRTRSLVVASSTLAYMGSYSGTATTTILVQNNLRPVTIVSAYCKTDTGTAHVDFHDGTNHTNDVACSTTPSLVTLSTNNTFTYLEDIKVDVGRQATNPNAITVSFNLREDAD